MEIDIESLERATLDAVAPNTVESLPGWLLPFDRTTIGRATSAVPLKDDQIDPAAISEIESQYTRHGYRAQFRVADVVGLKPIHMALRERGYTRQKPTLTMVRYIGDSPQKSADWTVHLTQRPSEEWKAVYLSEDFDPVDGANRVRALSRSTFLVYAHVMDACCPIAAGTASLSQGWLGLHGIRTVTSMRGRGCARSLIAALIKVAISKGIERCFLQVEEENTPAIHLYSSLGFQTAWRYHYWCLP
jgi:ribosomal protein S18 acetylase RimI-like enzyme